MAKVTAGASSKQEELPAAVAGGRVGSLRFWRTPTARRYLFGYTLLAQPQAVRRLEADRRLDPEELAQLFPQTLGADLRLPPSTDFGRTLNQRPAGEWKDVGGGRRFWQWPREER